VTAHTLADWWWIVEGTIVTSMLEIAFTDVALQLDDFFRR